ncbi:hypothetical protein Golomagni_01137 [Golovinomyces magnicellulatus]|nr:hypothetical protein Golomagni_01137 [Golovinomyces magnicellulatus]
MTCQGQRVDLIHKICLKMYFRIVGEIDVITDFNRSSSQDLGLKTVGYSEGGIKGGPSVFPGNALTP